MPRSPIGEREPRCERHQHIGDRRVLARSDERLPRLAGTGGVMHDRGDLQPAQHQQPVGETQGRQERDHDAADRVAIRDRSAALSGLWIAAGAPRRSARAFSRRCRSGAAPAWGPSSPALQMSFGREEVRSVAPLPGHAPRWLMPHTAQIPDRRSSAREPETVEEHRRPGAQAPFAPVP